MPKMSPTERKAFTEIFEGDFGAIQEAMSRQIRKIWEMARKEIEKRKGWDKLYDERDKLKIEQNKVEKRLHEIEQEINSEPLTKQQVIELGGKKDGWDRYKGANFFGIPIESKFEYEIVQLIKQHIDLEAPAKYVHDLYRSCMRELTMSGTFECAKEAYEKFYSLDFRKYGVDIAPKLAEVQQRNPLLNTTNTPLQIEDKDEVIND